MSGISSIIDIINTKTTEKEREILEEAAKQKKLKIEEAKRKAKEAADVITKKAELQAKAEMSRYEASAKLKSKYRMLQSKEQLIEDVLDTATRKLDGIVGKAEYKKVLTKLAIDGGVALRGETLELKLPKNHATHVDVAEIEKAISKETGIKMKVTISKEPIRSKGGVIITTPDSKKQVINTFEARLERLEDRIRERIASILFEDENKK
ncbi:MAG: V-type ATP synthase subunit E [Candidatus Thorarchaeota archaeon]